MSEVTTAKQSQVKDLLSPRHSTCAKDSLAYEIERLNAQTVEERIMSALNMKARFSWLQPAPITK